MRCQSTIRLYSALGETSGQDILDWETRISCPSFWLWKFSLQKCWRARARSQAWTSDYTSRLRWCSMRNNSTSTDCLGCSGTELSPTQESGIAAIGLRPFFPESYSESGTKRAFFNSAIKESDAWESDFLPAAKSGFRYPYVSQNKCGAKCNQDHWF